MCKVVEFVILPPFSRLDQTFQIYLTKQAERALTSMTRRFDRILSGNNRR